MTGASKQKLWIVLDHPMQLATALAIAAYGSGRDFVSNLLVSPHPYWSRVDINLYRGRFHEIFFLERPDYTWHPTRVLGMIFQIQRLKKKIARLNIGHNDTIIGLSIFHYLENIVLSMHRENRKIAMMPEVVYQECIRDLDKDIYYIPLEGWIANLFVEPLTGLYRTYCKNERLYPDIYWRIRYRKSLFEIYDRVAVLGGERENKPGGDNLHTMPYPYALLLGEEKLKNEGRATRQKVIFFGDSFRRGILGIAPEVYARCVNECLSFLREKYGATHRLAYRPHPTESSAEIGLLHLDRFEVERDGTLSELYYYHNWQNIYAVFSVGSTSSRSAYRFFLNAYSFLDLFPFDRAAHTLFRKEMGSVPDEFYLRNLSSTPPRYIKAEDIKSTINRCQDVLDRLLMP